METTPGVSGRFLAARNQAPNKSSQETRNELSRREPLKIGENRTDQRRSHGETRSDLIGRMMGSLSVGGVDHLTTLFASCPLWLNVERVSKLARYSLAIETGEKSLDYMHA